MKYFVKKKLMLAGLWKKYLLHMKNPQKLLEKSKSLQLNLMEFWSKYPRMEKCSIKIYLEEDVVLFKISLCLLD
jgi:hypothetical protein